MNFIFRVIFLSLIFGWVSNAQSQNCTYSIVGKVLDESSQQPLSYVAVYIQETGQFTESNDSGYYKIDKICKGEYHLIFSHIGCESQKVHIDVFRNTEYNMKMDHTSAALSTIVIEGERSDLNAGPKSTINRQLIEDNSNKNLSGILENEAGVHLIQNGSGVSKPIVHGLYGNRLLILNNGVALNGQQWGNDHGPEIDPFASDNITVLKGASALEYKGGTMGSIISVSPSRIKNEPHLHGQVNYNYRSNGRGHTLNTRLSKFSPVVSWRITGTLKHAGDNKTADYFLRNTGVREGNLSLQLEKDWSDQFFMKLYASTFNTRLGILRGSHIGNLTDLESALIRDEPFFTEPDYSDTIEAPRQDVSHHMVKLQSKYFFTDHKFLDFIVAVQRNDRKEFDVRRGNRTTRPALSLQQTTFNTDLKFSNTINHKWEYKVGHQFAFTDNNNNPETGILPLIPDYTSIANGIFATLVRTNTKSNLKLGVRYDHEWQKAFTFTQTVPREVIKNINNFHNFGTSIAWQYQLSDHHTIGLSTGVATRNPGINELYSSGLHQGVSGIEEGNENLKKEASLKNTLEYSWLPNPNFTFSILGYRQDFQNYIFLNPQNQVRLTIRGAFPVFIYEQSDATIQGIDVATQFTINNLFYGELKYSYLHGRDRTNNIPLVFMSPNSIYSSIAFRKNGPENSSLENIEIEINNRTVFEQTNILSTQDFTPPPNSYSLVGAKLSTNLILSKYKVRAFIRAENLFNIRYRDYLNRQRYFADDLGRNIIVGLNFKF